MKFRYGVVTVALAFVSAMSVAAQGTQSVGSVCKDGTKDATVGRGACSRHGGVDKAATAKATAAANAKAAKASASANATASATVTCKDGSTSKGGRGACAHHGGVGAAVAANASTNAMVATPSKMAPAAPSKMAPPPATLNKTATTTTHTAAKTVASASADNSDPTGATAQCKDGTYSHAKHHTGACGHHGGVAKWM